MVAEVREEALCLGFSADGDAETVDDVVVEGGARGDIVFDAVFEKKEVGETVVLFDFIFARALLEQRPKQRAIKTAFRNIGGEAN